MTLRGVCQQRCREGEGVSGRREDTCGGNLTWMCRNNLVCQIVRPLKELLAICVVHIWKASQ